MHELREVNLPAFDRALKDYQQQLDAIPQVDYDKRVAAWKPGDLKFDIQTAINVGRRKYTDIRSPILAIYAIPKASIPFAKERAMASRTQAKALATGIPSARIVFIPDADHYVFLSHEADVLCEMNAFITTLRQELRR